MMMGIPNVVSGVLMLILVMSGTVVESCPANSTEVVEASSRLNCGRDLYDNIQYVCAPNVEKTALVEFCYDGIMRPIPKGNCLEINNRAFVNSNCTGFVEGCPEKYYRGNAVYKHPACLRINTDYKCYLADPSCPNITRQFTTEDSLGSSTAGYTTEKGVYTTPTPPTTASVVTSTTETNGVHVAAIVGPIIGLVVLVIIGILIGIVVWKRRKKRKERRKKPGDELDETEKKELLEMQDKANEGDNVQINQTHAVNECEQREDQVKVENEAENTTIQERRRSRNPDDDMKKSQNREILENESKSLVNNTPGVSEPLLQLEQPTDEILTGFDDELLESRRLQEMQQIEFHEWEKHMEDERRKGLEERKKEVLGDYSVWKTGISDQFSSLSDDEVLVLFCFLCSDSGTPDFTDTDWMDILNEIREVYNKDRVTSEEAQRTMGGLKSRGFLWAQDGVHLSEDVEDETMYRVTGGVTGHGAVRLPFVYHLSSYTTAVRYLRSQRYTRKSGEKCVISDGRVCDSLLIRRLQMNILTHVTMEDTEIYNKVSQILCIPTELLQKIIGDRKQLLEDLTQTGECVQHRGGSQGSVQHVSWLWRNNRHNIVRSCIGLHPHCDIYIINNTAYRKHSQYHDRPPAERCLLYCLLMVGNYTVKVKDESHIKMYNAIRERYFTDLPVCEEIPAPQNPEGIVHVENGIKFKSDDIRHDVMYAFITECLVKDSDLKFFLTKASRDVISEYCRSWEYKRSERERCLYIPRDMYELFIDKLQLDILTHCTVSDFEIQLSISKRLGVPAEILRWDLDARKRYVEYAKRGTQVIHHARGMIVGCAGAGKTTLLKRLLRCSDAEIRGVKPTEGLEVHEEIFLICEDTKTLKVKKTSASGETIAVQKTLSVFDFAGQCAYYACHQIYLTRRAFYMLVVDASKCLNQVVDEKVCDQMGTVFSGWTYKDYFVFWIKSIHTYCGTEKEGQPDPEVIIVATHWDKNVYLDNKDSLITSLQYLFPKESTLGTKYIRDDKVFLAQFSQESPLEVLSDLEKYIFDIVCQKRWAENIPKEWAFMEVEIQKKKSTQRIEDIDEISEKMPRESRNAVYDMLRYYHDAGKILYFNETALKKLIIIDVQWFVDAFKNIITDKLHRKGVEGTMKDWEEYYETGHLKDCLLTEIWRKKDLDLQEELREKNKAAIEDDVSKDPRYILPHKGQILKFMNRLGLIAVQKESHYVPCMNRDEIDKQLINDISGSKKRSSALIFQFDFLPFFLFYQLVVASMRDKNWKELRNKGKPCLYKNAALFFSTDHHIALSVTETTIQLQVYLPGNDETLEVKKTHDIQRVLEENLQAIVSSSRRGKGYIRGFICEKGVDQCTITANTEHFISESEIAKIPGDKITCPLHGVQDHHYIYKSEITKYWKTSISSNEY